MASAIELYLLALATAPSGGTGILSAVKTSSQSVTDSTALEGDSALVLPLAANGTWMVLMSLVYEGGTTGSSDLEWLWQVPAGASITGGQVSYYYSGTALALNMGAVLTGKTTVSAANGSGAEVPVMMMASVSTGSTSGSLQLTWAQHVAGGTPTTVLAGSWVMAIPLTGT